MSQDVAEAMWLKHPKTGVIWLVTHVDTQRRCLEDGYTIVPDPRLPQPEQSEPAETQPSPSPDELAEAAEAQAAVQTAILAQVEERNDQARKWVGLEPAPRPGKGVRKGVKRAG